MAYDEDECEIKINYDKFDCLYTETYTNITNFKLIKLIGRGSFGKVYLAREIGLSRDVIIKIVNMENEYSKKEVEWLMAFAYCKKYKKYIPKLFYIFDNAKHYYIVMEHIVGSIVGHNLVIDLIVRFDTLPEIFNQILNIIKIFHDNKIVLNDLKPENLIIDSNGNIKLIDFGLLTKFNDIKQTKVGTPLFMPPENFLNSRNKTNNKKDIWSFGMLMIEIITGESFMDKIINQNENKEMNFEIRKYNLEKTRVTNLLTGLSSKYIELKDGKKIYDMLDIIQKCIAFNPNDRPDVDQLLKHKLFKKKRKFCLLKNT